MQYVLVISKKPIEESNIELIKKSFDENNSILNDAISDTWVSEDKKIVVCSKYPNLNIYKNLKTVSSDTNRISLIDGWIKHNDEDKLINANEISNENIYDVNSYDGFYTSIVINQNGNGFIAKSIASPIIYHSKKGDMDVFSNRVAVCSDLTENRQLNESYMANHILVGNRPFTDESLYKNVNRIFTNTSVVFKNGDVELSEKSYDILYNKNLEELFKKDKKKYWDLCTKRLKSQAKAFDRLKVNIISGVTGGKDSRLNLALYSKSLKNTFSWGPIYQTDVYIARKLSEIVNIPHVLTEPSNIKGNYLNNLSKHLFFTEFNKSAYDTNIPEEYNIDDVFVDGQEYGVRKEIVFSATNKKIQKTFNSKNKLLLDGDVYKGIHDKHLYFTNKILTDIKDKRKFKFVHNYLSRGETWVGAVTQEATTNKFCIYTLCTNTISQFCYNTDIDSIINEDLHYECTKRLDSRLLDCELNEQIYSQHRTPAMFDIINFDKFRIADLSIAQNYNELLVYIEERRGIIEGFINFDELKNHLINKNKQSPANLQMIYNVLQTIIMLDNSEYKDLLTKEYKVFNKEVVNSLNHEDNICDMIDFYEKKIPRKSYNKKALFNYCLYSLLYYLTLGMAKSLLKNIYKYKVRTKL